MLCGISNKIKPDKRRLIKSVSFDGLNLACAINIKNRAATVMERSKSRFFVFVNLFSELL
ncbi:MAG: hypothetical protein A2173_00475 [Planctomycetes bacterium RBG_13_44_8b]|nr:MAG: hypothetical protein A2173_00475 [Planctomycetes bacterium RBG_13_44_8b]